jgi:glycerophosphoryl diester phosphodiesterase
LVRPLCGLILWLIATSLCAAAEPLLIAHRGASGYRPEHTLAAYKLGIEQGADYLETDLVATRDGVLICRHDCDLGPTTDVAARFPERKATITLDGKKVTGFFAHDFTLEEVKTLRALPRSPGGGSADEKLRVPTFEELLQLVAAHNKRAKKKVGICPEIKHPAHHRARGVPLERALLTALEKYGYRDAADLCIIQSFDHQCLAALAKDTKLRLLQLLPRRSTPGRLPPIPSTEELQRIARYASAIGPHKASVVPRNLLGQAGEPTDLISRAHACGCQVWVYTFRQEMGLLNLTGPSMAEEIRRFADLGTDGLFTDYPDKARAALGVD